MDGDQTLGIIEEVGLDKQAKTGEDGSVADLWSGDVPQARRWQAGLVEGHRELCSVKPGVAVRGCGPSYPLPSANFLYLANNETNRSGTRHCIPGAVSGVMSLARDHLDWDKTPN